MGRLFSGKCGRKVPLNKLVFTKFIRLLFSVLFLCNLNVFISAQQNSRIAVLPFEAIGVSENDALTVTVLFETGLLNTGIFNVIEQNKLNEILDAQAFSIASCTDDACAIEVGELLSAEQIVLGSFSKVGSEFIINAKIIDVAKGSHLKADKISFSSINEITESVDLLAYKMAGLTYKRGGEDIIANQFADVLISTDPSEADIYINGILKGKSPDLFSKVPFGIVRIEARKGTLYAFEDIDVSKITEEINLKLLMQYGNLFIKCSENDIDVFIDDTLLGPLGNGLLRDIPAGNHLVKLLNQEFYWEEQIFIEPNISTKIEAFLRPYGHIEFEIPEGAEATVIGEGGSKKLKGEGTITIWEGKYAVTFEGENYISKTKEITVNRGSIIKLNPELEYTAEYVAISKEQAYTQYQNKLTELENGLNNVSESQIDEYITNVSYVNMQISNSNFVFPELRRRCEHLLNSAEIKRDNIDKQQRIENLYQKRNRLQQKLKELKDEQRGYGWRRGIWGALSLSTFAASGYLFYESENIYGNYNNSEITSDAISFREQTTIFDIGKYSSLGLGSLMGIISLAIPSNKEQIKKIEKDIINISVEIAALEAKG